MQLSSGAPPGQLPARALQTRLTLVPSHAHVGTSGKSSLSVGTSGKSTSSIRTLGKREPSNPSVSNDPVKRQKSSRSPLSQEKDDHEIPFELKADTSKFTLDNRLKLDDLEQRDVKITSKRVALGKRVSPKESVEHSSTAGAIKERLEFFRSEQSARARAKGTTVSNCKICEEEMSRDPTDPRRHCLFECGHSSCGTCWSKISSRPNFVCPWCRQLLSGSTPHKMEGGLPLSRDDGTFIVHIKDRKNMSFDVSCCWSTKFSEILDLLAPMRLREFEDIEYPRERLQMGIQLAQHCFIGLHDNQTLNDVGYENGHQLIMTQRQVRVPEHNELVAARFERRLGSQDYPDGVFTLRVCCFVKVRPVFDLDGVNKEMTLFEIGQLIKDKLKPNDLNPKGWYGAGQLENVDLSGSVDKAIWDQDTTLLKQLRGQGHGKGKMWYC